MHVKALKVRVLAVPSSPDPYFLKRATLATEPGGGLHGHGLARQDLDGGGPSPNEFGSTAQRR
jgi:hypothetical protein